jgi:hypothetical protein
VVSWVEPYELSCSRQLLLILQPWCAQSRMAADCHLQLSVSYWDSHLQWRPHIHEISRQVSMHTGAWHELLVDGVMHM